MSAGIIFQQIRGLRRNLDSRIRRGNFQRDREINRNRRSHIHIFLSYAKPLRVDRQVIRVLRNTPEYKYTRAVGCCRALKSRHWILDIDGGAGNHRSG